MRFPKISDHPNLVDELVACIDGAYQSSRPIPEGGSELAPIEPVGVGLDGLGDLWRQIVAESTHLASPWMIGHMDTAPHPVAALTQALVASLNNNLLFRELSPLASRIEEQLIGFFAGRMGLGEDWGGIWASGGSVANLTALFAAVGGYQPTDERGAFHLVIPESGHASLEKAAKILGLGSGHLHRVTCDDGGRVSPDALRDTLSSLPVGARPIVVSVLGSTIHGSVDDIAAIADVCDDYSAWHHVDAIYGGALALITPRHPLFNGIERADSIVLGPQKWMYVPRVSAAVIVNGKERFDQLLGFGIPYSISDDSHRGYWGIQGSRPADAVVLWTLLRTLGTETIANEVKRSITLTKTFHDLLEERPPLSPAHHPDLNLQLIACLGSVDAKTAQARLAAAGETWLSLSRWRDQQYLRCVLLSPTLSPERLEDIVDQIHLSAS